MHTDTTNIRTNRHKNTHKVESGSQLQLSLKYQHMSGPEIKTREDKRWDLLDVEEAIPYNTPPHTQKTFTTCTHIQRDPDSQHQSHPDFFWLKLPDSAEKINNISELYSKSYYDIYMSKHDSHTAGIE